MSNPLCLLRLSWKRFRLTCFCHPSKASRSGTKHVARLPAGIEAKVSPLHIGSPATRPSAEKGVRQVYQPRQLISLTHDAWLKKDSVASGNDILWVNSLCSKSPRARELCLSSLVNFIALSPERHPIFTSRRTLSFTGMIMAQRP
jgi:hypothetical protein